MCTKKKSFDEIISIEVEGKLFIGRRIIEGTRTIYQTIYYEGLSKSDGHPYKPNEEAHMRTIAKIILRELIQEAGYYPVESSNR